MLHWSLRSSCARSVGQGNATAVEHHFALGSQFREQLCTASLAPPRTQGEANSLLFLI